MEQGGSRRKGKESVAHPLLVLEKDGLHESGCTQDNRRLVDRGFDARILREFHDENGL